MCGFSCLVRSVVAAALLFAVPGCAVFPVARGASAGDEGALPVPPAVAVSMEDNMVTLVTADGRTLISPNRRPLVERFGGESEIDFVPVLNGFDARVTLRNPTGSPVRMPTMHVGGIRFGQEIGAYDFRIDCKPEVLNHRDRNYSGRGAPYPGDNYSPVEVLHDDQHTIGFSLLYPVLEYEHRVRVQPISPGGMYTHGGRNWEVVIILDGDLPAGAEREYVIAVRVQPTSMPWQLTLLPYREYFHSLYGGVRYTRDSRPVAGQPVAILAGISPDNPRGYVGDRPDVDGWRSWANKLRESHYRGFDRFMVWVPTGLYDAEVARPFNFPAQFMTELYNMPRSRDTLHELSALADIGMEMGYWWGHSQWVATQWNPSSVATLDRKNPDHVRRMLAEVDVAAALGAKMIGLDAFAYMPDWEAYRWLRQKQERYPGMQFIAEPSPSDIIHTLAASFFMWHETQNPHYLADFLLPGHESWVGVAFNTIEMFQGRTLSTQERRLELERAASWGYVNCVFDRFLDNPRDPRLRAAESWRNTLPQGLPDPGPWREPVGGSATSGFRTSAGYGATSAVVAPLDHVEPSENLGSSGLGLVLSDEVSQDVSSSGSVPSIGTGAGGLRPGGVVWGPGLEVMGPSSAYRVSPAVPVVLGSVPDRPDFSIGAVGGDAGNAGAVGAFGAAGGHDVLRDSVGGRGGVGGAGGGGAGGGGGVFSMGGGGAGGGGGGGVGAVGRRAGGGSAMGIGSVVPRVVVSDDAGGDWVDELEASMQPRGTAAVRVRGGAGAWRSAVPVVVDRRVKPGAGSLTEVVGVPVGE